MTERNIFLLLGSNQGDRLKNLSNGIAALAAETGTIAAESGVYKTAPWGKTGQPDFLNQAIQLESSLSPQELLSKILAIEKNMGRSRSEKWEARLIDIDIIYFGNSIVETAELVIPHQHASERKFVLVPLVEISADFIHPLLKKSNSTLLRECGDALDVEVFEG